MSASTNEIQKFFTEKSSDLMTYTFDSDLSNSDLSSSIATSEEDLPDLESFHHDSAAHAGSSIDLLELNHQTWDVNQVISIHKNVGEMSATMTLNLNPYIESFKKDNAAHLTLKKELTYRLTGFNGTLLWTDMIEQATANISKADKEAINNSPANQFMQESFIELVKNVMDEAILGYLKENKEPQLELRLDIGLSNNQIKLSFEDSGRGFPELFLARVNTVEQMKVYTDQIGSSKQGIDRTQGDEIALFGGAGRGLRIVMARILYGDRLKGDGIRESEYTRPNLSEIAILNHHDVLGATVGGRIQITTSLEPLQAIKSSLVSTIKPYKVSLKLRTPPGFSNTQQIKEQLSTLIPDRVKVPVVSADGLMSP